MKFTATPFTILRNAFTNESLEKISCFIDNTEVPVKECDGLERIENVDVETLDFWDTECKRHPSNSQCKVYDE